MQWLVERGQEFNPDTMVPLPIRLGVDISRGRGESRPRGRRGKQMKRDVCLHVTSRPRWTL